MSEKLLKNCPFCGQQARCKSSILVGAAHEHLLYVECVACCNRTRGSYYSGDFNWGYSNAIEPEIDAWNKRI